MQINPVIVQNPPTYTFCHTKYSQRQQPHENVIKAHKFDSSTYRDAYQKQHDKCMFARPSHIHIFILTRGGKRKRLPAYRATMSPN